MNYTESDLTPWFPADVKPARPGMYVVRYCGPSGTEYKGWSYWSGSRWGSRNLDFTDSYRYRETPARGPIEDWRGLAFDPAAKDQS